MEMFHGGLCGLGDVYVIANDSETRVYLVANLADGTWLCSCKRDHESLRKAGRYCPPVLAAQRIAKVLTGSDTH